ncbi:glyoxalase superfamily protein [Pseudomonas frederiksbergensis]|uniref:Uncharacterized protein n=1 Tax=Pseudomonas frederiksbergensis TaxID=104087 RepID=A0A0B1Z939_9PSED|nr:glyoxalase superfamily protein [Pseudomonas frederiksbergensis]KHK65878.1 hypothetical protein JZ00_03635 [Pseudomonas frederiksbergensis]
MSKPLTPKQPLTPELLRKIKREAKVLRRTSQKTLRHRACLCIVAQRYGFESWETCYESFQEAFKSWRDQGKDLCAAALADERRSYYFVQMHDYFERSFFSHWVGWSDDGYELRVPSEVDPAWFIGAFRESNNETLYVIETKEDYKRWMLFWHGPALIECDLMLSQAPRFLSPEPSYSRPRLR